jgi:hypothetical protein
MADLELTQAADRAGLLSRIADWLYRDRQSRQERVEPRLAAPVWIGSAIGDASAEAGGKPTRHAAPPPKIDPSLRAVPPAQHAELLLAWLQEAFPTGADIAAATVMEMHNEMMLEEQLAPIGWIPVAKRLREMTGGMKRYVTQGRNRVRAYRIPPRDQTAQPVVTMAAPPQAA